jgi:hypothetical protein
VGDDPVVFREHVKATARRLRQEVRELYIQAALLAGRRPIGVEITGRNVKVDLKPEHD